jgi:hypothetical protein
VTANSCLQALVKSMADVKQTKFQPQHTFTDFKEVADRPAQQQGLHVLTGATPLKLACCGDRCKSVGACRQHNCFTEPLVLAWCAGTRHTHCVHQTTKLSRTMLNWRLAAANGSKTLTSTRCCLSSKTLLQYIQAAAKSPWMLMEPLILC